MKLVERLVDVNKHEPPSEYESDVAAVRLSVATSQLEDFDPVTPPPPAKLSEMRTAKSRQALRATMNLDGLIACRPQMPTPSCGHFVADATGMRVDSFFVAVLILYTSSFFLTVLLVIVIPHLEMRACDWSKSRHVTFTKSGYFPHEAIASIVSQYGLYYDQYCLHVQFDFSKQQLEPLD